MSKRLHALLGAAIMVLLIVTAMPQQGSAQDKGIEIGATYSYMWGGSYNLYEGEIQMDDGSQWGGNISFALRPDTKLEFYYANQPSHAKFYRYYTVGNNNPALDKLDNDVTVQYFQLGSIYQIPKGNVQPFLGIYAGAVMFHPKGQAQGLTLEDKWNFAMSFAGGVKLYASEKFGIRLQGRLLLPMYFSGGGIYVGTGGAGVGLGAGVPIVQGDVGVGLFLRI